jgi:16S rRNA (cytosine967-C5)-methyltransferase
VSSTESNTRIEAPELQLPLARLLLFAAEVVAAVADGQAADDALAACLAQRPDLPKRGRPAIQDLAYTALRAYGRGDFLLGRLMAQAPKQVLLRALLLVALARLEARPAEAHLTVDQAVDAAGTVAGGRFKGLVNGVLRNFLRNAAPLESAANADEVASLRHPAWWLARLRADFPAAWRAIAEAGNGHPPMALRVNRRRMSATEYLSLLAGSGIEAVQRGEAGILLQRPVPVSKLPGFFEGLASVQDLGAQQAAALLDGGSGMRVLDACAAPGGKSAHLLEVADVDLTALDADDGRMVRVRENFARLGLAGHLVVADCRDVRSWWDGRPFERILADVPCSASGVVRRHPDIKWLRRPRDIARFCAQQAQILDALWQVLAPDGKLLYATCSVFADENSRQIMAFAERHRDCERVPVDGNLDRQLLPDGEHDGFYYASLRKMAR